MKLTGGKEHDNTDHASRKQRGGVSCQTELSKDRRCVVENGVDSCPLLKNAHLSTVEKTLTCPLLEKHRNGSNDDTLEHGLGFE